MLKSAFSGYNVVADDTGVGRNPMNWDIINHF